MGGSLRAYYRNRKKHNIMQFRMVRFHRQKRYLTNRSERYFTPFCIIFAKCYRIHRAKLHNIMFFPGFRVPKIDLFGQKYKKVQFCMVLNIQFLINGARLYKIMPFPNCTAPNS